MNGQGFGDAHRGDFVQSQHGRAHVVRLDAQLVAETGGRKREKQHQERRGAYATVNVVRAPNEPPGLGLDLGPKGFDAAD